MQSLKNDIISGISGQKLVALGANLPSRLGSPVETLEAALLEFQDHGVKISARSRWYRSAPVPASSQNWYINGVISIETDLGPAEFLAFLHEIEAQFGRERGLRNAARVLDLDLIAWGNLVRLDDGAPELPHPRMHDRAFVLLPFVEIAPDWVHPVTGVSLATLIEGIPEDQIAEPIQPIQPG